MSSMRNAVQRRNHRERGQLEGREKWGILEKHKASFFSLLFFFVFCLKKKANMCIGLLSPRQRLQPKTRKTPTSARESARSQPR
jgi:Utp11 protein